MIEIGNNNIGIIIVGYSGIGKSYLADKLLSKSKKVLDLDISSFRWLYNSDGDLILDDNGDKIELTNWCEIYINAAFSKIKDYDIILISAAKDVVDVLSNMNSGNVYIVTPDNGSKDVYVNRYRSKETSDKLVNNYSNTHDSKVEYLLSKDNKIVLSNDEYLSDRIVEKDGNIYLKED